jgi:hypothetical protein
MRAIGEKEIDGGRPCCRQARRAPDAGFVMEGVRKQSRQGLLTSLFSHKIPHQQIGLSLFFIYCFKII